MVPGMRGNDSMAVLCHRIRHATGMRWLRIRREMLEAATGLRWVADIDGAMYEIEAALSEFCHSLGEIRMLTEELSTAAADIARKAEVDNHAELTNPHSSTSSAVSNRLILRDAYGRAQVAAPSAAADIARKDTVDAHANSSTPHKCKLGSAVSDPWW